MYHHRGDMYDTIRSWVVLSGEAGPVRLRVRMQTVGSHRLTARRLEMLTLLLTIIVVLFPWSICPIGLPSGPKWKPSVGTLSSRFHMSTRRPKAWRASAGTRECGASTLVQYMACHACLVPCPPWSSTGSLLLVLIHLSPVPPVSSSSGRRLPPYDQTRAL